MGSKTNAPPPVDPYKAAGAQFGTNIGTAAANTAMGNANTYGPTGQTIYNQIGNETFTGPDGQTYQVPRYESRTTLSPEQQKLYDQQTQIGSGMNDLAMSQIGMLQNHLGRPVDYTGLPSVENDFSADRQRVEQAMFERLNPQLERDRSSLETQLVNQGFQRGTQAFNEAMDQYGRQVNDARLGITAAGLREQQGLFGMSQANRNRAFTEYMASRNQPINEITALMSGGQVSMPNAPNYNPGQVGNTDVSGAIYNSAALANQNYGQEMQSNNAMWGGLAGLGGAGLTGLLGMPTMQRRLWGGA